MPKDTLKIKYCVEWGYLKPAASLADAISETFGVKAELIEEHNGIFEILYGNIELYSNREDRSKVPANPEALELISQHIKPLPGKENKAKNISPMA
jgi:predicted Rdx family selenoprotein